MREVFSRQQRMIRTIQVRLSLLYWKMEFSLREVFGSGAQQVHIRPSPPSSEHSSSLASPPQLRQDGGTELRKPVSISHSTTSRGPRLERSRTFPSVSSVKRGFLQSSLKFFGFSRHLGDPSVTPLSLPFLGLLRLYCTGSPFSFSWTSLPFTFSFLFFSDKTPFSSSSASPSPPDNHLRCLPCSSALAAGKAGSSWTVYCSRSPTSWKARTHLSTSARLPPVRLSMTTLPE